MFALGASLFILGGTLWLNPDLAARLSVDQLGVATDFFAGSSPFTTAAYLQLFQAANAQTPVPAELPGRRLAWFGWHPGDIGWLGCAFQFAGTVLFNINTFDALVPGFNWFQQDLAIWAPDMIGSALFLSAGYLAFIECTRSGGFWQPAQLSWWIAVVNFAGCVAFMISGVLAFVPAAPADTVWATLSTVFTVAGAAAFLLGSLLMLPEPQPGL